MKSKLKVMTSLLLAVVMTVMMIPVVPGVTAATVTYSGSASYMSGPYYTALTQVEVTGDPRTDIVNIARSQIGYQEAGSTGQYSGTVAGANNYTEYGYWYGVDGGQWCAMFVSWCAYVAGVSSSVIPYHSYTENGISFFLGENMAYDWAVVKSGAYVPQPGDVVYFYSGVAGRTVTHVGIVEKFEGTTLYTIEGNASTAEFTTDGGCCCRRTYDVNNTVVKYICRPQYESSGSVSAPTVNGYYTATGYYKTTASLNVRSMPSSTASGTTSLGTLSSGTTIQCVEVCSDTDTSVTKYWAKFDYNGTTAYTSLNSAYMSYLGTTLPDSSDPYALSVEKTSFLEGEAIPVQATGTKSTDWVGIYKKGESPDVNNGGVASIYWTYITKLYNGETVINGGAYVTDNRSSRSDSADFADGLPAGEYTVNLFQEGTYTVVKSVDITVTKGNAANIDVAAPVWFWDFGQQAHYAPLATTSKTEDYVTLTDSTGDSFLWPGTSDSLSTPVICGNGNFFAIKMRVTSGYSNSNQVELLFNSGALVVYNRLDTTSDWQYIIIDCSTPLAGTWSGTHYWFRIDPVNCNGSVCDIDWVGQFESAEAATNYMFYEINGTPVVYDSLSVSFDTGLYSGNSVAYAEAKTTVETVIGECESAYGVTVTVTTASGATASSTAYVATGMTLDIGGTAYTVVVAGDTSGNGYMNIGDVQSVVNFIRGTETPTAAKLDAMAAMTGSNECNIIAATRMLNEFLGIS